MMIFNNKLVLVCGLGLAMAASTVVAQADNVQTTTRGTVLSVPAEEAAPTPQSLPQRSMTKAQVRRQFGSPKHIHAAIGEPPITRWDYPEFRVYFEYDLVLHAVVPGEFPPIDHRNQLISGR